MHTNSMVPRESEEYKAALEVELWKDIKMEEYMQSMTMRERKALAGLKESFRQREAKRDEDLLLSKKLCDTAVKQYKDKLTLLEKREAKLGQNNSSLEAMFRSLNNERLVKLDDVKQKSVHKADFLSLELDELCAKVKGAESLNLKLVAKIERAEKALSRIDSDITNQMLPNHSSDSSSLSDELLQTKLDFFKTKEELSRLTIAKERYKLKLKNVLHELSGATQTFSNKNYQTLSHQQPLLHVKDEAKVLPISKVTADTVELQNLRSEIDSIVEGLEKEPSQDTVTTVIDIESEIAKLINERNTLLNTGVYLSSDFIIQQIDSKIKKLINP